MKENNHSAEYQLLNSLREMAQKIAEHSHCGEKDFSFDETAEEMQIDFPVLLRQSLAEVLAMRKDVETAEYFPIDVPYQPDIAVRTKPLQKLWLISPLKVSVVSEESQYIPDYEILSPEEAVRCQREINAFIEQSAEPEEEHRGLMAYYPEGSFLSEKIFSAFPYAEVIDGKLMGVLKCQVCGKLTPEELTELKSWWTGQAADGFGESLEQHEIRTEMFGNILVSFWEQNPDWNMQVIKEINQNTADTDEEESPEISGISM